MSQTKKYISLSKLGTYHTKNKEYIDSELQALAGEMLDVVEELDDKIDSKANATHKHNISDINNLQGQLDSKANKDDVGAFYVNINSDGNGNYSANATHAEILDAISNEFPVYAIVDIDGEMPVFLSLFSVDADGMIIFAMSVGTQIAQVMIEPDNSTTFEILEISPDMFGADPAGSAEQALQDAKDYTDEQFGIMEDGIEEIILPLAEAYEQLPEVFAAKTHDHEISDVSGLQGKLDSKSEVGHTHTVDSSLSSTSTNPVQNKVVNSALSGKVPTTRTVNGKALSANITLSASDVGADAAGSASAVQDNLNTVEDKVDDHIANENVHFKSEERTKLAGIAENANNYSHPNSGVSAGSYTKVTVDAQGHVTGGSNPTTLAGYGIKDAEKSGAVSTHNSSSTAHSDIRNSLKDLEDQIDAFFYNITDTSRDQLIEVLALIDANIDSLSKLASIYVQKSNVVKDLGAEGDDKVLSATYGQLLQASIADGLSGKVDKVSGKGLSTNDFTAAYKTKLDGITAGAEVNQNAFSNIVVGSTTVAADSKTDSLTLEGSNVTITADATNDKVTFSVANGSTSAKGLVKLTNSTSSTSTTTAATPSSVKSAYDLANTANTAAGTAQTKANSAYDLANTANTTANTNKTNLSSHTGSTDNPHSVTKGQVGLGNVPNVATNDQTPTYTAASSLTALTSGEKLSVSMGKLSKAVSSLISHLDASNPHGISKSTIGLGNVDNTSDANKTVKAAGTATTATTLSGLTATIAELNILDGVTATAAEINKLDGLTATTAQLNKTATLSTVATSGSYNDLSNKPSIPTVYTESQCTTFTSDAGTVTPLAVQKAAKMFAITRPSSTVANTIARYSNTTGDVKSSTIKIEDVTNTKDSSQKAEVISIPAANGTKKMVYGYCTDQVDGTSFIGGLFDADATEFPYASGLSIGGSSGNLLWKGAKVAVATDIPTKLSQFTNDSGFKTTDNNTTYTISKSGSTVTLTGSDGSTSTFTDANTTYTPAALGSGYGTCSTAAATVAKVVTLSNYALTTGGIVSVKFTNAVPASATMNINSKGAKPIYYKGKAIVNGVICAGEVGVFVYDGSYYHLIAVDRNRFYTSLVPYGTSIEASESATVNLNTPDYMKVGNYFCSSNAKAKYVSNIPKKDTAFMMQVYSPLSQTVDDESSTWRYRLRKIMYYTGEEYTQYCYTDGTGGNWLYGAWKKTVVDTDTATTSKAGLMSAADKTKLDGLQGGGGFDFDALINASGYSYTYVKSTGVETIKQGSTTYATRTSTKNASTGVWTVVTVCSAAGVNVTKTYTPSSTGWTVA